MGNKKNEKIFLLPVCIIGFFLWFLAASPIMGQSQTNESSNLGKKTTGEDEIENAELTWLRFLFFNPFRFNDDPGWDICPPLSPDWEIKYNRQIYDLSNFELEGNEIKTIRFGFAPPPTCYVIPVEKNSSSKEKADEEIPIIVFQPQWGFGFHGGATFPIIDLGTRWKYSFMLAVNAEYYLHPQLSIVASIGFNKFRAKPAFSYLGNTYWWNLSANLKWEFTTSRIRPYIHGGGGLYIPKTGFIKPGLNVGAGLNRLFNPNLVLDFGIDYHRIIQARLKDIEFYTVHAGLVYLL
ncbi:MAG TPA: hypothetical protein VK186_06235 [Candidatus Deferrimicrobium sp.]|nr:hypothetical protein [Candidatus Deferrimicrobium sp.]